MKTIEDFMTEEEILALAIEDAFELTYDNVDDTVVC